MRVAGEFESTFPFVLTCVNECEIQNALKTIRNLMIFPDPTLALILESGLGLLSQLSVRFRGAARESVRKKSRLRNSDNNVTISRDKSDAIPRDLKLFENSCRPLVEFSRKWKLLGLAPLDKAA